MRRYTSYKHFAAMKVVERTAWILAAAISIIYLHTGQGKKFGSKTDSRPNIVLIVADDLGWNDVSFHGSSQIPTPYIDKLANEGIILKNYYVAPICTPSRSSLLTGKYPIHLGTQQDVIYGTEPWGLSLKEKLLPEYLKALGYETHAVGKWHLGFFKANYTPVYRGFDDHFGYWTGHADYFDHTAQEWEDWGLDLRSNLDPVTNLVGRYITDVFTEKAEKIILQHDASKPLFLYLAHLAVHSANSYDPLQTTPTYYGRFPNIKHEGRRLFAGMTAGLDDSVARVFKALQSRGMDHNTIIVFTTDNGGPAAGFDQNYANNWPLRGVKDTLWEGGVRGTAFIWSPLIRNSSSVSEQLMHISDWLPTLVSAAGGKMVRKNLDGMDMWSALRTGSISPRTEILLNIDHVRKIYAIRCGNYKLMIGTTYNGAWDGWYPPEGDNDTVSVYEWERAAVRCAPPEDPKIKTSCQPQKGPCLFNIKNDPCEFRNLATEEPTKLRELMVRLQKYNATVVVPRNQPRDPAGKPQRHGYVWSPWRD